MRVARIQSVMKAFVLIDCFSSSSEWVTATELAERAHLPRATGYRLIKTLEDAGAILQGEEGLYRLSLGCLRHLALFSSEASPLKS